MANTVIRKSYLNIRDEIVAGGAITPGHLLARNGSGNVVVHGTADGAAEALFAIEDAYSGKGIDDAYAANDTVMCWKATPGDRVNAIAGAAIAVGAFVTSAGDGRVQTAGTPASGSIVGVALTAAAAADDRITIEIV